MMETEYSPLHSANSENEEKKAMPISSCGTFQNPWKTWRQPGPLRYLWMLATTTDESNIATKEGLDEVLPIIKPPDIGQFKRSPLRGVQIMWIGHATVVAQLDGFTVITDPVFSTAIYIPPRPLFNYVRYRETPCTIEELPKINAVLISHNHYDHLDYNSVVALNRRFGRDLQWFVPMGLQRWMNDAGCENVVEMTWWDEHEVQGHPGVKVACTPCQHWCQRNVFDKNKVLWSSWCVLGPQNSFHFAGDTGYCDGFKQIGRTYGPFTAAAIPIGAYHPRGFMAPQHVDPNQAVQIHCDLRAKSSIGIHWGTFALTREHYLEPRALLRQELEKRGMNPASFITISHGAVSIFGNEDINDS